ncbi:uncharacterized protein BN485_01751 [Coprococcus sp. CAG:131]|nr:uncharacterized protein BN485_01751 [Coprococcus sp. CAG:131]
MKIITGKTGKPHVTSADDRALHRAEWDGDGFLSVSQPPVLVNSTTLRVYPCDIMFQGCHARVTGTYEDLTFPSGETGKKRIDMLVARYTLSEEGLEDMSLLILTGQSVESSQEPQLPVYETGIIANNVSVADMPLYKIVHDGINASGPVAIASTFPPLSNKYTKEESDLTTKNINQAISKAEKTAAEATAKAQSTADTAASQAEEATGRAEEAQKTADTAVSKADKAQGTADTAKTDAANAQSYAEKIATKSLVISDIVGATATIPGTDAGITLQYDVEVELPNNTGRILVIPKNIPSGVTYMGYEATSMNQTTYSITVKAKNTNKADSNISLVVVGVARPKNLI